MSLDENLHAIIEKLYIKFCERYPSENEVKLWINRIHNKEIRIDELSDHFKNSTEYIERQNWQKDLLMMSEELIDSLTIEAKKNLPIDKKLEPSRIIISVHNKKTNQSTIYSLENDQLTPIFSNSDTLLFGMYFHEKEKILLVANVNTKINSQIFAFKLTEKLFKPIPVIFNNYIIAKEIHGICIFKGKFIAVETAGGATEYDEDVFVPFGRLIVSEIDFSSKSVLIKNSIRYNPFSCNHHHHVNDLCEYNGDLYLSSFSYCIDGKNEIHKGAINKLDENFNVISSIETMPSPHSLSIYEKKMFFCSSGTSSVLSLNLADNTHKLEIKCQEAWARGLLCTPNFIYLGYSSGKSRTKSVFTNDDASIMKFNKITGEAQIFRTLYAHDNVYCILGI